MPTCPECHNFLLTPGRCPRDKKPLIDEAEAKKRGIIPKIAERYQVQVMLGEGGMGTVYLALHETLQRKVAIKILRREGQQEDQAIARFKREAKAASLINHRHVVSIMDFGELPDNSAFYVLEHLEGKSLADAVDKEAPFPLARALSICVQVSKGLKAAHEKGVVHRDLKPDNVFLLSNQEMPDFVKILDFGVAKVASDDKRITTTGMVLGTPDYMAPEQAIGKPTDHRVDIYALGVMLYEMITGELPFTGQTFMEVLSQHIYHPPPLISERYPEIKVPPEVDELIQKALKKRPENRFQTMDEVLEALFAVSNIQEMLPNGVQMSMVGMPAIAPNNPGPMSVRMAPVQEPKAPAAGPMSRKVSAIPEGASRRMPSLAPKASPSGESTYLASPPRSVTNPPPASMRAPQNAASASYPTAPRNGTNPPRAYGSAAYPSSRMPQGVASASYPTAPRGVVSKAPQSETNLIAKSTGASMRRPQSPELQTMESSPADLVATRAFIQPNQPSEPSPLNDIFDSLEETNIRLGDKELSPDRGDPNEDDATRVLIDTSLNPPSGAVTISPEKQFVRPFTKPPVEEKRPNPQKALSTEESPRPVPVPAPVPQAQPVVVATPKEEPPKLPSIDLSSVPQAQEPAQEPQSSSKLIIIGAAIGSFLVVSVILYFLVVQAS